MKLSKYCENNENKWEEDEIILLDKLIKYLNSIIEKDLYEFANTKDSVEVYNILNGWLFNFYKKEFIKGLNYVEIEAIKEKPNKAMIQIILDGLRVVKGTAQFAAAVTSLINFFK